MVSRLLDETEVDRAARAGFQFGWNAAIAEAAKVVPDWATAETIRELRFKATSARSDAFQGVLNEHLISLGREPTKG